MRNFSQLLWSFFHGAYKVTIYVPELMELTRATQYNELTFAAAVEFKMREYNPVGSRTPLGGSRSYAAQKLALTNG